MKSKPLTYADAGVNLSAWADTKKRITGLVKSTFTENVVGKFGQFGGLFDISMIKKYEKPILVSSVDGIGTKLKIAFETGMYDTLGEDIVNHCVNDILVMGAQPLFFLDYIGMGVLSPPIMERFITGLTRACKNASIVLIGGETAEMPDMYSKGEFDVVGTIVGVVEENKIIDGSGIVAGDAIVGLGSNGLHTNGYSLARKIVTQIAAKKYSDTFSQTGKTFGEELLRPHRSYLDIFPFLQKGYIKGCAHITGGGFQENVDRILPESCNAIIDTTKWTPEPIFTFLGEQGNMIRDEKYRTFNMGIGMVCVVAPDLCESICTAQELQKFEPRIIGSITEGNGVVIVN